MRFKWLTEMMASTTRRKQGRVKQRQNRVRPSFESLEDRQLLSGSPLTAALSADRLESNNTRAASTDLGAIAGTRAEANLSIHTASDVDWFKFTTSATGTSSSAARIDFTHAQGDLDFALYNSAGSRIALSDGSGNSETLSLDGLAAGTFYVKVYGYSGAINPTYNLTVTAPAALPAGDRFESNNTQSTATDLGIVKGARTEANLSIHSSSDIDWYKVTTAGTGSSSSGVRIDFTHAQGDIDMALYDGSGHQLAVSDGSSDSEQLSLSGRAAGTYFVKVYGYSGATNSNYTITVNGPTGGGGGGTGGVTIYAMPDSGERPILDAINGAQRSIDLEIYQITDDNVTTALVGAAQRGVAVRVMLEPKTVGGSNYTAEAATLQAGGVVVQATPPQFDASHNVDHAKFIIIDGQKMMFGTGNFSLNGLGAGTSYNNRDFWVADSRSQSVNEAQTLFTSDWNRQDTTSVQFVNLVVTPDNADQRILDLIDSANTRLYVYNQEMYDPTINQHVIDAKHRGVDVEVLSGNPVKFFHQNPSSDKNAPVMQQFVSEGIPAYELTTLYVHTKVVIADNSVFVGSQNFSNGGLFNNREVGEIFRDAGITQQFVGYFLSDMQTMTGGAMRANTRMAAAPMAAAAPTLTAAPALGTAGTPIALNIQASSPSVVIGNLPASAVLRTADGTRLTGRSQYSLAAGQLAGLRVTLPTAGTVNLTVMSAASNAGGNASATTIPLPVTVRQAGNYLSDFSAGRTDPFLAYHAPSGNGTGNVLWTW